MRITANHQRLARDVDATNAALARFAAVSKSGISTLVRQSARRVSANLAYRTQPFGNSAAAQNSGKIAVRRDILRVYATPGMLFELVEAKAKPSVAGYFYGLCKRGEWAEARKLLRSLGIDMEVRQTPNRSHHQAARNSRGRVPADREFAQLVGGGRNGDALERYITRIQRRVGWAASGWSACAAQLGGTRGIVNWKKRGRRGPGMVFSTGGDTRPTHNLINHCPYIRVVLPIGEIGKAVRREEKTLRQMTGVLLRKNARKQGLRVA